MEKIHQKLVRDRIPEIILGNNKIPIIRQLDDEEYQKELEKKLFEETQEVVAADAAEKAEELADVIEVIQALALLNGKSLADIIALAEAKRKKRGGFQQKLFLEKTFSSDVIKERALKELGYQEVNQDNCLAVVIKIAEIDKKIVKGR